MHELARQAQQLFQAGRPAEARRGFAALAAQQPGHAPWWFAWGACELAVDAPRSALMPLERACQLPNPPPRAWLYLALARQRSGSEDWQEPLDRAEQLLTGNDLLEVARSWIAGGRPERVARLVRGPLAHLPDAWLLDAQLARRAGDPGAAAALCRRVLDGPHPVGTGNAALTELGHALDKLGRFEEAWTAFDTRNQRQWAALTLDVDLYPRQLASLTRAWDNHPLPPPPEPADDGPVPAFVMGFPRSGTTLTEQILARHPDVNTLDERSVLVDLFLDWANRRGHRYPVDLVRLTTADRRELRQRYRTRAGMGTSGCFVDKLPLNWPHLPLARALFPESPIVVLLRDPRDACLSALMQDFAPNEAMVQFLVPERTGRTYDQVRQLGERYAEEPGLEAHRIRYEDLVSDTEAQVRGLLAYLELPWDERVLTPHEGTTGRYISTPSRHQVARPIHTGSIGRHERYPQVTARLGVERWVDSP